MSGFERFIGLAVLVCASLLPTSVSAASADSRTPVITSEDFIADCLCAGERVRRLRLQADEAQQQFNDARSRMNILAGHVNAARPTVDPDDEAQLDAFRRLLAEQDNATNRLFDEVQPHAQDVIRRYNAEAKSYTDRCAGKSMDSAMMTKLQAQLACLKPDAVGAQPSP